MMDFLIIFSVSVLFVLLFTFTLVMRFQWKSLIKNGSTTVGFVENVKEIKSNGSTWYKLSIRYYVADKSYTNKGYISKIHSFVNGQEINIRYLNRYPNFSTVCDDCSYFSKPFIFSVSSALILYLYLFALLRLTVFSGESSRLFTDIILMVTIFLLIIVYFFSELGLMKKTDLCKGIIIFSEQKKDKVTVVAEYMIGNNIYQTREMMIPLSQTSGKTFNVDDEVMVRYYPSKPYLSIIADDIYSFKTAKTTLIITFAAVLILIALYFARS